MITHHIDVVPFDLSAAPSRALEWIGRSVCPLNWPTLVRQFGGGFFHAPPGLRWSGAGPNFFLRLQRGDRLLGIAAGRWQPCRLSRRPVHAVFPALPAVADDVDTADAWHTLVRWVREHGAADVTVDGFDTRRDRAAPSGGDTVARIEYLLPLDGDDARRLAACSAHHRRHLRSADAQRWQLRLVTSDSARRVHRIVQGTAAFRAARRGEPFETAHLAAGVRANTTLDAPWGLVTFAAFDDTRLLAAAVVGHGGRRAYYLSGGSTPEGYARSAATWMHWKIAGMLREHGFTEYALGGAASPGAGAGEQSAGLHRFKRGFGARAVASHGTSLSFRASHRSMHRLGALLAAQHAP